MLLAARAVSVGAIAAGLIFYLLVASLLLLVGAARARADFDHANPLAWLFVAAMAAAILTLYLPLRRIANSGAPHSGQ